MKNVARARQILAQLNYPVPPPGGGYRILDFGCGDGETVYAWRDAGYDCFGFDITDYLAIRNKADRLFFSIGFAAHNTLPFEDCNL